ncbi:MAG: hypothetical protein Q7U10_08740 [Thermodesulfovibrionia bacterium]|nr:hypothetical protein [Thermodesulfovibrionia bacterium]
MSDTYVTEERFKDYKLAVEKLCDTKHSPLGKDVECLFDKLRDKAEKSDLDKKADQTEVEGLKDNVKSIDRKFWAVILLVITTLIAVILK